MNTRERIEKLFPELLDLIKTGQFTREDIIMMEKFLEGALKGVRKVKQRMKGDS